MSEDPEPLSRSIYNSAQAAAADDEDLNGAMLLGSYTVCEWAGQNGTTFLSEHSLGADGFPLADWRSLGYLTYALKGLGPAPGWMMAVEDEDDDE